MGDMQTDRLRLRPAEKNDLDQLHEVFSNPIAMKYWSTLPHKTLAETSQFIEGMISIPPEMGEEFVVDFNGVAIGKAGFWRLPEIGFIFHPKYWGKGLAHEAVSVLINYGFVQRKVPYIVADVDPRNGGSIRLLEKLGFHQTHREARTIKIGDEWCDSVYYKLDAPNGR